MTISWEEIEVPIERSPERVPAPVSLARTEDPEGVAWLSVLGTGVWGYADSQRVMRNFPAGVHRVDQETVDFALRANSPNLVVTAEEPILVLRELEGPLSLEHLRLPADRGYMLLQQPATQPGLLEESTLLPYAYPCPRCGEKFPSAPPRDRHVEDEHSPAG